MTLTKSEVAFIVARLGIIALVLTEDELELIYEEILAAKKSMPATTTCRPSVAVRHTSC